MSGDVELGTCEICGEECPLQRKYWYYDIKCECHSPRHFEMVRHCNKCTPIEPDTITVTLLTCNLKKQV